MSYIEFKDVVKEYKMGDVVIKALDNTNFSIDKGELVAIVGPSGAGKTTQLCSDALNVDEILDKVGLKDRKDNFPAQLSGGEQQRVAIARAIAKNPKLLLCDEPTGALDYKTGKQILKLLQDTCRREKMTVVIITHNTAIAPMADKVIHFKTGTAENIVINEKPISIDKIEW